MGAAKSTPVAGTRGEAWSVRVTRAEDEPALGELVQQVYGKPLAPTLWRWKFGSNADVEAAGILPTTPAIEYEWVVETDERIVGHYGVIPLRFSVDGRECLVPLGCDRMTHPAYRQQGIYTALGQRANAVWREAGAPFQCAFIPGALGTALTTLGWQPRLPLVWMKCWLHPLAWLARRLHLPLPRGVTCHAAEWSRPAPSFSPELTITRAECATTAFDELWELGRNWYDYSAVRDRRWVQWRYFELPGVEHEVLLAAHHNRSCGYLAYRLYHDAQKTWALLLDCFTAPDDALTCNALLRSAQRALRVRGIESMVALAVQDSPLYQHYRRAGFRRVRSAYQFSIIPYTANEFKGPSDRWFISGAEGDVGVG